MKYYSENLKKLFDSPEELEKAEKELSEREAEEKAKREQRAVRAKEVEDAWNKYQELLKEFVKDYGSYHHSSNGNEISLFDIFFNWPF